MPDTNEILDAANKLGQLVAQHPAVAKYRDAQRAVAEDPDANRLMSDFNRLLENAARMEAQGMGITDAQRHQLESLQTQLASHLKMKSLQLAQVEFIDLLRKVNQAVQRQVQDAAGAAQAPAGGSPGPSGPRLVI